MNNLLALLLFSTIVFSEENKWWENFGDYSDTYDILILEDLEEREKRFFNEAENVMSLACRSEIGFNKSDRNMSTCREEASNTFVKPLETLLYFDQNKIDANHKWEGLKLTNGKTLKYLDPSLAAILVIESVGAMLVNCIPENIGIVNTYNQIFIPGCRARYDEIGRASCRERV